mgnify:FL=1
MLAVPSGSSEILHSTLTADKDVVAAFAANLVGLAHPMLPTPSRLYIPYSVWPVFFHRLHSMMFDETINGLHGPIGAVQVYVWAFCHF